MSSKKNQSNTLKAEDVIQAVLIADNFSESLAPYCADAPLGLLHLVNVPLLNYALEYLEASGIHECFIYLCKSPDAVKQHLSGSRWLKEDGPMMIQIQTAEDCMSLGDVMRDLDAKALIQSDFLLMSVDCVTNVDVVPLMKEHSARRKGADRGLAMTLLYREASPGHRARRSETQVLLAAETETGRLVHHQRLPAGDRGRLSLPLHIFQDTVSVELQYGLLDPGLAICSPTVPQLFADNFDFQTRDHFVKGIIVNEEVMGNTIYYRSVGKSYAAQITSVNALLTVTHDVLDRWVYPVVPESRAPSRSEIRCLQRNVYRHRTAQVGSGTRLEGSVSLGAGCEVGKNCRLVRSVVGAGCRLGDGVVLEDTVLEPDCRLGGRSRAVRSLLARGVRLGDEVVLEPGCVLSAGVSIQPLRTVAAGTRLAGRPPPDEFGDGQQQLASDIVGEGGCGYLYLPEESEELRPLSPLAASLSSDSGRSSDSELEDEQADREEGAASPDMPDDPQLFYNEVLDSLVRGYNEKIRHENLILEVNSSKFAYNVTVQELNTLVVKAILSVPEYGLEEPLPPQAFLARLQPVLATFMPLLTNYIKNPESERSCIKSLEAFSCEHAAMSACLAKVLMLLYQKDILSEATILSWYSEDRNITPEAARVRQQVKKLVDWLQEADEESDEESDEDSE